MDVRHPGMNLPDPTAGNPKPYAQPLRQALEVGAPTNQHHLIDPKLRLVFERDQLGAHLGGPGVYGLGERNLGRHPGQRFAARR